jgi:DNA modification methylase
MNIKTSELPNKNLFATSAYDKHLLTIKEASVWATNYLGKKVTVSNISYLIQYGRVRKIDKDGMVFVSIVELNDYYNSYKGSREIAYREKLGDDLNWALSFDQYKEAETTKHVHRLHPYKGKFIPQLVEYFLDEQTDNFKKDVFFHKGDIVLDPFSGSGTTMVEACELGINAVGIDVSAFNALISNAKAASYDIVDVEKEIIRITNALQGFIAKSNIAQFEEELLAELYEFNNLYFPVPEYKYKLRKKEIDEEKYAFEKEKLFLPKFKKLIKKYDIKVTQDKNNTFLGKWFSAQIRAEIDFVYSEIKKVENENTRNILCLILSRTMRSCRATTHADLGTLLEPVTTTYYCSKHGKICKPLFSILKWWKTYTKDTVQRILEFGKLRTPTKQICLVGDSRTIDIFAEVNKLSPDFGKLLARQKIAGIFSSPPYVGLIDYHEQHAYAYDLFKFPRNDELEIGPLFRGQGNTAKESYIEGIAAVLNNCKKFFAKDYNIFLVANDKYNMYPTIAEKSEMTIVQQFHRPVLNRTERDKAAYSETIFHLKEKQ